MSALSENGVPALKWVAWETTRKCNLDCVHCRSAAGARGEAPLDTGRAFLLMDRIAEAGKPVFVLSGGEPLLRPDIFELAAYGSRLGFRMAMATNGTLLTADTCRRIKDSGIKIVSVSLDGPDAATHDGFRRQEGAFEKILKGVGELKAHGVEFIVNSSFTRRNQDRVEDTCRLARELGAKAWYMFMVVPMGRADDLSGELISPEDYERILKWHLGMEAGEKKMLVRPTCAPSYYRLKLQAAAEAGAGAEMRSLSFSPGGAKGCVAAQSIAYIDADGAMYPCSYFPLSGGSLFERSVKEIWDSELFRSFRGDYKGQCGACEYRAVCGGCRARSLARHGDHLAADPYCAWTGGGGR